MRAEKGSATVVLTMLMGLTLVLCGAVACVGAIAAARVRASTAADLAALAAARDADCAKADEVAANNNARLFTCQADGADMLVEVQVSVQLPGRQLYVTAWSRAGPP